MNATGGVRPIPNKLYFRIGEVSELTGVQPYTLRHWEMEFPTLNPKKNDAGQRLYRRRDIEVVQEIQRLLHHEGYTTAGARRRIAAREQPGPTVAVAAPPVRGADSRPPAASSASPTAGAVRQAREALVLMERNDRELARLLDSDPEA